MSQFTGIRPDCENVRVELVDWAEAESAIRMVREAVFISEQAVPEELEWDGLDRLCTHALAWSGPGCAIATARMQADGKIGRMAVLKGWRGSGCRTRPPSDLAGSGRETRPDARNLGGSDPCLRIL